MIDPDRKTVALTKLGRTITAVLVLSLIATCLIYPATSFAATTYYVDPSGSDSNPGTSAAPWRTIQKAANTMSAGDTTRVRAGNYSERVSMSRSGASGAPITFEAEGTVTMKGFTVRANYVTIRGFEITDTPNVWDNGWGIFVEGSRAVIENNYVHFATRGGILLWAEPGQWGMRTDSIVRNNRLYHNAMVGVEFHGRNHLVEGNEVWRTIQYHPNWVPAPSYADADGMRFFGSGHIVKFNYIHDINYSDPENVNPHIDCFQTWGSDYQEAGNNILFERNHCEVLETQTAHESGNAFMLAGAYNLTIRNNLLQAFKHINVAGGGCHDITIVHNTFTSDLSFPTSNFPVGLDLENSPYVTAKNNIFYNLPGNIYYVTGTSSQGLNISHNLAYRSDGQTPWGTPYANDLWGVNPRLQNPGGGDYHLQSSSPAIDSGASMAGVVPDDFYGTTRPQGSGYDRGMCEYGGTSPTATPTLPPPTPTPTTSPLEVIVDNQDPGFTFTGAQDAWQEYVQSGGQHYGGSHRYNRLIGTGLDVATWTFSVPQPGKYAIYAWWCDGSWRPADVPYVVSHAGGTTEVRVNQQVNGGQWNQLGTFDLTGQGAVWVRDDVSSGQDIVADAVRAVYVGPPSNTPTPPPPTPTSPPPTPTPPPPTPTSPPPTPTPPPPTPTPTTPPPVYEVILDNDARGFSTRGTQDAWQLYTESGGQHYGNSHRYNRLIGTGKDVASWTTRVSKPGRYEVYAWWWDGAWRAPDAPYVISHLDGSSIVRVNQQINGGRWNLLGTYRFDSQVWVGVRDDASSGQDIVADAIRLVYVGP